MMITTVSNVLFLSWEMSGLPFCGTGGEEWDWTTVAEGGADYYYDWTTKFGKRLNSRAITIVKKEKRGRPRMKHLADLSHIFLQPPEILIEVLTHLHPLDLFQLSRTTKQFRALIMTSRSEWLWSSSFKGQPDLPPCPPDMPYPKWADLLFGAFLCQDCEETYGEPNFSWRRRLCWTCMSNRVKQIYKSDDTLTKKEEGVPAKQAEWKVKHDNTQLIADRMAAQDAIVNYMQHMQDSLPWKEAHFFEDKSLATTMEQLCENATLSKTWATEIDDEIEGDYNKKFDKMKTLLSKRFKCLGHTESDITSLVQSYDASRILPSIVPCARNPLRIVRRHWMDLRPKLSLVLKDIINSRIEWERKLLLDSRMLAIRQAFSNHCDSLPYDIRETLPTTLDIILYEPFSRMVNTPTNLPLDNDEVSETVTSFLESWPPKTLDEFSSLFPNPVKRNHAFIKQHCSRDIATASFVFRCAFCEKFGREPTSGCIVGWQSATQHLRCGGTQAMGPPELSERGCIGAMGLLELLGLDPHTTLPSELEERNLLFTCVQCSNKAGERSPLLSWKECIFHFIKGQQHKKPVWKVLSAEDIEKIQGWKAQEDDMEGDIWESAADLF